MIMIKYKYALVSLLFTLVAFSSCSNAWEEHYSAVNTAKSDLNLYEYIKSQSDLSTFAQMLEITGYDSILNKPQTYTVWAPVNSSLSGTNLADTATLTEIVKNHITRFSQPTSGISTKTIYVLGKKFLTFKKSDTGFSFGGKELISGKSDIATSNGILHCIDGYVPYISNIWEYIGKTPGLDSLRAYLYSQTTYEFDVEASVEIGTNEFGQAIYDSVITFKNPVLDKIGHLQVEDSTFTAILPNNAAWTKAYNQIKNGYKTLVKDGGAAQQRLNTQWALVKNLIFRKQINEPTAYDSLYSSTGSKFMNPAYLFDNAVKAELSNGLAYVTDSLRFKAAESWQQSIKIEAENSDYGRSYVYANLLGRSGLGSIYSNVISGNKYLIVEPTTVSNSTQNAVTFPIPNTLSGKYNIYCVFVPGNAINADDTKPYKVSYYFSYLDKNGVQVTDAAIDSKNLVTLPNRIGNVFTTKATEITKMFVTQFDFPFCNLIKDKSEAANITIKLKVKSEAKITETALYSRTFRVDYIVLEPAE